MPTIFSGRLDGSDAVRFHHVSLVMFYLRNSRRHAEASIDTPPGENHFRESMLAVVLAALCLEAFANEMGENIFSDDELEEFFWARGLKTPGKSTVARKIVELFRRRWEFDIAETKGVVSDVDDLFALRNDLVHYKLSKSAGRSILKPMQKMPTGDGGQFMTVVDFVQTPVRTEPSLVQRVNCTVATRSYNTAFRIIALWNEKANAPKGALGVHAAINEPSTSHS